MEITRKEFERIKDLKELDFEICDFRHINILNLGRKSWGKFYCRSCEKEHILCPELCYKVAVNILDCQLYQEIKKEPKKELIKPNRTYDLCSCYSCGKELKGQRKHSLIKNRNNPSFWEINTEQRILCLNCLKKKHYWDLGKEKRKMLNKYIRRGYV